MKDDRLFLIHVHECMGRIAQYTADGRDAFLADTKTQDAVIRNLQILAESAPMLSEQLRQAHPEIDWRGIRGFRNVVVHDYLGVDIRTIWDIVERDLPPLRAAIAGMLKSTGGAPDTP